MLWTKQFGSRVESMAKRQLVIMTLVMTFLMGVILSAYFTYNEGPQTDFLSAWLHRFWSTYLVVLPTVAIVAPIARLIAVRIDALLFGDPMTRRDPAQTFTSRPDH